MTMIYQALRPVGLTNEQVQVAGRAIDTIKCRNGGVCAPVEYVDAARPEDSPIHDTLPWDDYELAEQRRREIAGDIVQVVVVERQKQPQYINVSVTTITEDEIQRGYASVEQVRRNPGWQAQAEREFLSRVRGDCINHSWLVKAQQILAFIESMDKPVEGQIAA